MKRILSITAALLAASVTLSAQKYNGIIDKTVATVGGETILLSDLESEVQQRRAYGMGSESRVEEVWLLCPVRCVGKTS